MQELLTVIAQGLVDDPSAVKVTADEPNEDGTIVYHISVAEADMGRIIGKQNCQSYPHNCSQRSYPLRRKDYG
jgi:predicted RNA-binding protein YlqC (UPF0109 family)